MVTTPNSDRSTIGELEMKNIFAVLILALGFSLLATGCSSAPTEEINATKEVLQSIQNDDVSSYAPESLAAAEDAMSKALAEVQTQDQKFTMFRDYKQSATLLKSAKDLADKAKNDAQANKIKAKADAEAAVAALPPILLEAAGLLAKAPKGKDTKADLEIMQSDLKLAEEAAMEANNAISAERYLDALAKANTAKEKAGLIIEQVKAAQQKVGRRS